MAPVASSGISKATAKSWNWPALMAASGDVAVHVTFVGGPSSTLIVQPGTGLTLASSTLGAAGKSTSTLVVVALSSSFGTRKLTSMALPGAAVGGLTATWA